MHTADVAAAATLARANSYAHMEGGKNGFEAAGQADKSSHDATLTLSASVMRRTLRATSLYDQSRAEASSRPPAYSWPCTSLCIIPAVPHAPVAPPSHSSSSSSSSASAAVPYDLLLLGTHVHPSRKGKGGDAARKSCLYVAILPHVLTPPQSGPAAVAAADDMPAQSHPLFRAPSLRARNGLGGAGAAATPGANVRVIPSYGEFASPSPSASASLAGAFESLREGARSLCGGDGSTSSSGDSHRRRRRHNACTSAMTKLWRAVRQPLRAVGSMLWGRDSHSYSSLFSNSGSGGTRSPESLLRHYPRISSLGEHGVHLAEESWPWRGSPFYGLELVWAEEPSPDDPESELGLLRSRELPIHPSHLCLDPLSGEIILTDHDTHAVYRVLPSWVVAQRLRALAEPVWARRRSCGGATPAADPAAAATAADSALGACSSTSSASSASSPSVSSTAAAAEPAASSDFVLPLPDDLLDIVVSYVGNQVSLVSGQACVKSKGCRDGAGSHAHFNAPNGVAVHPRTGALFVTDGHWNSRICSLQLQGQAQDQGMASAPASASAAQRAPAPQWTVATVPMRLRGWRSGASTWWSAVRHTGIFLNAPAFWPLRLPTAPVVLPGLGGGEPDPGAEGEYSSDALVLLDEELHILRHIPLAASASPLGARAPPPGVVSTISGRAGAPGARDGWAQGAQFLFPQALISLAHPLGLGVRAQSRSGGPGSKVEVRPQVQGAGSMARRQALLLADTGNDRLCLVNLVSRAELRLERRRQSMLRRQMRALRRQQQQQQQQGDGSDSSDSDSASESESDSDVDADADPRNDSGPLVGHVETVQVRGQLAPEYDGNFIRAPWSPWSDMALPATAGTAATGSDPGAARAPRPIDTPTLAVTLRQRESAATASSSSSSSSSPSSSSPPSDSTSSRAQPAAEPAAAAITDLGASASLPPPFAPLTPLPFVHRGQNTFVRKLVVTSQGKIVALNRLGLQVYHWAKDDDEIE